MSKRVKLVTYEEAAKKCVADYLDCYFHSPEVWTQNAFVSNQTKLDKLAAKAVRRLKDYVYTVDLYDSSDSDDSSNDDEDESEESESEEENESVSEESKEDENEQSESSSST